MSTWTPNYTKLLISIKKEKQANFTSGKMRKKEAWSTIAEAFNAATDGVVVRVTSEQCANKWKKFEEKFKKTEEHNAKTGRERKTCEFYEEFISDCLGDNPKIIPVATVSSAKAVASTNQREEASTTDDSNDESSTLDSTSPKKRRKETPKKRRRSKSSASEMIDFLKEFREEKKEDQERVILIERMHADKMKVMRRFLSIMDKK